jgi:two-component system response regulator PilR (NtrC family)
MQVKLLRVIQERKLRPVGASAEVSIDVRILSATHKNLARLVDEGRFRHDLFYRINVIELPVPPLRERREDIPLIADALLKRFGDELSETALTLSPEAMRAMSDYAFPGNVRELENILERAVALCEGLQIQIGDLQLPREARAEAIGNMAAAITPALARITNESALPEALELIERDAIQKALEACRYNKTKAAAQLGITFRALRYKLKKLGME